MKIWCTSGAAKFHISNSKSTEDFARAVSGARKELRYAYSGDQEMPLDEDAVTNETHDNHCGLILIAPQRMVTSPYLSNNLSEKSWL